MISKFSVLYQTILVKSIFASFGYNPNNLTMMDYDGWKFN